MGVVVVERVPHSRIDKRGDGRGDPVPERDHRALGRASPLPAESDDLLTGRGGATGDDRPERVQNVILGCLDRFSRQPWRC